MPPAEPVEGLGAVAATPETTGDVRQLEQLFGNILLDADRASSTLTSRHARLVTLQA